MGTILSSLESDTLEVGLLPSHPVQGQLWRIHKALLTDQGRSGARLVPVTGTSFKPFMFVHKLNLIELSGMQTPQMQGFLQFCPRVDAGPPQLSDVTSVTAPLSS